MTEEGASRGNKSTRSQAFSDTKLIKFAALDVLLSSSIVLLASIISKDWVTSTIIGLLCLIIGFGWELRARMGESAAVIQAQVDQARADVQAEFRQVKESVAQSIRLHRSAVESHFPLTLLEQIVEGYGCVAEAHDTFFLQQARAKIAECAESLRKMQDGHLEVPSIDLHPIVDMCLEQANSSVFATSFARIADFWTEPGGPRYLEENIAKARNGMKITRVFILDAATQLENPIGSRTVRDLILEQRAAGIDVRIAFKAALADEWRLDMAIFDNYYVAFLNLETRHVDIYGCETPTFRKALEYKAQILQHCDRNFKLDRSTELPAPAAKSRRVTKGSGV